MNPDRGAGVAQRQRRARGVKLLLGRDPKKEYGGKVADVNLPPRTA